MADNENILGERLKDCRKRMDLTQHEVAEKLGVTSASISSWESGARRPDFEMLDNISNLYDVSFDYLLGRINAKCGELREVLDKFGNAVSAKYESIIEDSVINFLSLDLYGQNAVMNLIENEWERCREQETLSDSSKYQVMIKQTKKKD